MRAERGRIKKKLIERSLEVTIPQYAEARGNTQKLAAVIHRRYLAIRRNSVVIP